MKLKRVVIKNFRSIKHLEFEFPESNLLVLVGPNNSGKSNIIRAINLICGEDWVSSERLQDYDFYLRDKSKEIRIELIFDNGSSAIFSSSSRWPEYRDVLGNLIRDQNIKEDFPSTYLGADRAFDRHISFYDWSLLGKIRKTFHKRAYNLSDKLEERFNEIVDLFDQVPGFSEFKKDFGKFFEELQADVPLKMSIDFKPFTPSNYFKTMHILASDPNQNRRDIDLDELGEGTRNLILLALLRSYAVNLRQYGEEIRGILALEEPEIYLHPQAQRNLFRILREIVSTGLQVIISTHSNNFVDTEFFDSIGLVRKVDDPENKGCQHTTLTLVSKAELVEHCYRTGVPEGKATIENITEYYKSTSNYRLNEAFFARFLILVEGETEELALPEYLAAVGLNCDQKGVSVIAVQGKNQIPKYWRLFGKFKIPMLVVFDNDDDGVDAKGSDNQKRKSNKNLASCFGLQLEQILHGKAWDVVTSENEPATPIVILGKEFETAVKQDYENTRTERTPTYEKIEEEAHNIIKPVSKNQAKGLIARYIARRIHSFMPDYAPQFVKRIAEIVKEELGFY
ncbi:AAA family ATPase [Thermoanaerobacter sp. CM-CNRG TB177]|jgi:putative ATP-dependent endonuclease of OLD family|nr:MULTISPECIES: AAA family ATPase [unclassified Thermoanaerobacter]MBT1279449.1 AAA family ATPase [Thermoanaerobacter sp. CM-CNRG TB177]